MGLQVVTPGELPVTLVEAKAHLRLDSADEDDLVMRLIRSATERAESFTGRTLCTAQLRLTLDGFPCGREIELPAPPLRSITSVKYFDVTGELQTLPPAAYHQDETTAPGLLVRAWGARWPATQRRPGAVRIDYEAGYGAPDDVPAGIKEGILLAVGDGYAFRETLVVGTVATELKQTVEDQLRPYRIY